MTQEEQHKALESLKNQVININKRNGIKMSRKDVINWLESTYLQRWLEWQECPLLA